MNTIGLILTFSGLLLAVIFWIIPFRDIQRYFQILFQKVSSEKILALEKNGLLIKNKELISDKILLKKNRIIYWPVVPTMNPCIIHATFIRYLKPLSHAGLHINILIFDAYYKSQNDLDKKTQKSHINQFKNSLIQIGLNEVNHTFLLESNVIKRNKNALKVLEKFFVYFASLKVKSIYSISKHKNYSINDLYFLRFMKPILNMSYLSITSKKYGYTMSGIDEEHLWETYNKFIGDSKKHKLTNFYIPLMRSISGKSINVSEKSKNENINITLSLPDIEKRVRENLKHLDENSVTFYALKYCYFSIGNKLLVKQDDNSYVNISSVLDLNKYIKEHQNDLENIITYISQALLSILKGNQKNIGYDS